MQHPDLKPLLWGKHLSRMLGVCGIQATPPDPAPRIVSPVPGWYQRLAAILTIAGLVGCVHAIDISLRSSAEPSPWWDGSQAAAFDTTAWTRWAAANGTLALAGGDSAAGEPAAVALETSPGATSRPRWMALGRPASPASWRRPRGGLAKGHIFQSIDVTAYTSRASETDSSPDLTASNTTPRPGTIALSRDLLRTFTPDAPFDFGDKLLIPGVGVFEAHDTMNSRWNRKADIWFASPEKARAWGRRTVFVTEVGDDVPTIAYQAK